MLGQLVWHFYFVQGHNLLKERESYKNTGHFCMECALSTCLQFGYEMYLPPPKKIPYILKVGAKLVALLRGNRIMWELTLSMDVFEGYVCLAPLVLLSS